MKKKRMAVKRTAGKPLCEMELKVRERYSETHYGGKQPEICRHVANAMTFSTVFEHRDRSRHRHRSNRRRKATFDFCREMYGAPAKNCSVPENRDASISRTRMQSKSEGLGRAGPAVRRCPAVRVQPSGAHWFCLTTTIARTSDDKRFTALPFRCF